MRFRAATWFLTTAVCVWAKLPDARPVSTTYASTDPQASAQWMVQYMEAEIIPQNITSDDCGDVAWVRLPGSLYEFHFVKNPNKPTGDSLDIEGYVEYVDALYGGNLSKVTPSTYDIYMDFHVGMSVDNMTNVFYRLYDGNQGFFMVGADSGETAYYDLFVEIPGTGMILELSSLKCVLPEGYKIELWDICASHARAPALPALAVTAANDAAAASTNERVGGFGTCDCDGCVEDTVCWRKTTYASVAPEVGSAFSILGLGAHWIRQGHPGINMQRCALIAWSEFNCGYQMHFVDGLSYPQGPMTLENFTAYVEDVRDLDAGVYDQWMDNHMTLWVDDLQPFADVYDTLGLPYLLRAWPDDSSGLTALIVAIPRNGVVVELLSDRGVKGKTVPSWDLCSPASAV